MKLTKTFKSVNFIDTAGDAYAQWNQLSKHDIDAVMLTVTDEDGNEVYYNVIRKGGMLTRTLSDCRAILNTQYRIWKTKA